MQRKYINCYKNLAFGGKLMYKFERYRQLGPYGWLNINWIRQTNDCIRYTIDIPAGTSATFVPFTMQESQKSITLQTGKHSLELDFTQLLINQQ